MSSPGSIWSSAYQRELHLLLRCVAAEVVNDPAVVDNGYLMAHPTHPPLRLAAAPAQFDSEIPQIRRPGPEKGEHTREVLSEIGFTDEEIAALITSGAVVAAAEP